MVLRSVCLQSKAIRERGLRQALNATVKEREVDTAPSLEDRGESSSQSRRA